MSNILVIFTEFPMYKMRVGNLAHYFFNLKSSRDVVPTLLGRFLPRNAHTPTGGILTCDMW